MSDERAGRLYRLLLLLAPRRLREEHGSEMEELFLLRWREAGMLGRWSRAATWARALGDVIGESARALEPPRLGRRGSELRPPRRKIMLGSDIRCAARSLLRQPVATSLIVVMLALGIAANVTVFALVNGLFLRPFPFPHPERLVYVNEKAPRWNLEEVGITFRDLVQWQKEQRLFEAIAWYDTDSFNVSDGSRADRIRGARVTHEFADVLSVRPALGRFFSADEDRPGGPPAVVLGHSVWRERFAGDEHVIGRTLRLDGVTRTIVGVMPEQADFPGGVRVLVPFAADPEKEAGRYGGEAIGRMKPGVTAAQAEADLLRAQQPIWEAHDKEKVVSPYVQPLREHAVRDFKASATALSAGVALLLLVACANVASLMLARALARRREMAIRVAVGAGGWRLLGQLLAENLLLAGAGGALGLAGGYWTLRALVAALPDQVPRWAVFGIDARVSAFAVAITGGTVLLFGWAPAFHALRDDLRSAMSTAASGTTASPRGRWTLRMLVGGEFALAALLLVCGALLFKAFDRVRHVDPGFEPRGVLTFGIHLPPATYPDPAKRLAFWEELVRRMQELPGVESAGAVTCAPLGCHWGGFFDVEGRLPRDKREQDPVVLYRFATPSYFRAMGVRLKAGRLLDDHDGRPEGTRAVLVNEAFVRAFLPGVTDPVGQRLRQGSDDPWSTVVGLVADVKHYGLEKPMRPGLYFPLPQSPAEGLTLALKTHGEPGALAGSARAVVRELDPDLGLYQVRSMEEAVHESLAARATYSWMLAVFALLALVLALGGTYGVTAYLATQRAREIGIRLALGARTEDIRRSVLAGSVAVVATGIGLGVVGSLAASRWLSSLLFGVAPHDLVALGEATGLLVLTSLAANWASAARAARVDPMSILRTD